MIKKLRARHVTSPNLNSKSMEKSMLKEETLEIKGQGLKLKRK
jgi:hypothetical protein